MLNNAQLLKRHKAVLNSLPLTSPNMQRVVAASNQVRLRLERRQSSSCASAAEPADVSSSSSGASAAMPAIVSSVGQSASAEDSGVSASGHFGGASSSAVQSASVAYDTSATS